MIKKITLALTVCFLLSFTLTNNFRDLVIEKLSNYTTNYPEKIYVHTDKPYYTLGEDLWFSTYLVNGITHKESWQSNVVYVELIDANDSLVDTRQLLVKDLSAAGDFKLDKKWKPGTYTLRAYSNYMRNHGTDYFFQTEIPIWDVSNSTADAATIMNQALTDKTTSSNKKPEIGFYPEGGYLVNNIPCKVAIKVKDKTLKKLKIKGAIYNNNDEVIASFETYKFGLAVVKFTPEANTSYHAKLDIRGKQYRYDISKALPQGHHLEISNIGKQLRIKADANTPLGLKNTFLVAHQRGKMVFEKWFTEDVTSNTVTVDTKFLQDGVTVFTLFDNSGNPVCERLAYVDNPDNSISVNLTTNRSEKNSEHLNLQFSLNDAVGTTEYGNLSVAITSNDAVDVDEKLENIKTYLLLNSDLRGHIEQPGYFFQKENDFRRRFLLDLLMLTHGWRRFSWQNILYKNSNKQKFEAEKGIYISGHTTALKGNKQQIPTSTRLTIMGKTPHQESQTTDKRGRFKYGPYVFNDTLSILLEARRTNFSQKDDKSSTNKDVAIHLENTFTKVTKQEGASKNFNSLSFSISDTSKVRNFLKQAKQNYVFNEAFLKSQILLDEVVINAQKKSEAEAREKALNEKTFYGSPSHRLDLSTREDQRPYNIINLINQIPSVQANIQGITIRNQGPPIILLDGFQVQFDDISFLTGEDVDYIDVLIGPKAAFYSRSSNGVLAIYLRNGVSSNINVKRKPGIVDFTAKGFYSARDFYSESTPEDDFTNKSKAENSTIYWAPKIMLTPNNSGNALTTLKTDGRKGNFSVKIEGITQEGIPFFHLSSLKLD